MKNYVYKIYFLVLIAVVVFSYGFVDINFPYQSLDFLHSLVYEQRVLSTTIYVGIIMSMFVIYALLLSKAKKINSSTVWKLVWLSAGILLLAYPAFSNDIFNYIATAKVTYLYGENPYLVMPIEIENEPMLMFMHAANKFALYGLSWITLSAIPHFLGLNNLLLTMLTFKLFIAAFYIGLCLVIWRLSSKNKYSLIFFALNPLVLLETFVGVHNDVVAMFFALLSYYLLQKKRLFLSLLILVISIFIKYATMFLLPVYIFAFVLNLKKESINWDRIWSWSAISMFAIFMLSPLREEMYSWYFIWPISFIALLNFKKRSIGLVTTVFSFGLLLRFVPFIYTREWGGITPLVKTLVTLVPPIIALIYTYLRNAVKKT